MLNIQKDVKLSDHSTFKIGGPAKEFVVVKSEKELIEVLNYVNENKMNFFILGGGSNILFDDRGFDGIVIKIGGVNRGIKIMSEDEVPEGSAYVDSGKIRIKCWAGEPLFNLVNFARDNGITGMEWAVGILGTVGGAISGNAGAFGGCISDFIESVRTFKILNFPFPSENKAFSYSVKKCNFGYRSSIFKTKDNLIVLSAKFNFQKGNKEEIELKMRDFVQKRLSKQPKNWYGCAGSFFKNPIVRNDELRRRFEIETGSKSIGGRIPAGWIIEHLGFKGKKMGNVMVSDVNANFLINTGGATAEEVIMAAGIIKHRAKMNLEIQLKEEVKYISY